MLKELVNAQGISGNEMDVRAIIRKHMIKYVDKVYVDKIGNLIAHKKGGKPTVMLAAHMDEVGVMVKGIEANGKIRFSMLGGIENLSLLGQRVRLGKIAGVVTTEKMSAGETIEEIPDLGDMYIDTGLTKKELQKKGIDAGTYVAFDHHSFSTLGSDKIISGKALDDRVGCYVLMELARKLKKTEQDIYFVFTVQEEIGLYGSKVSAYSLDPDWAIAVDVTDENMKTKKLGKGPCIMVKDAEMLGNRCINSWLRDIARKKKIPFQLEVSDAGTTDALSIAISKEGIPTSIVGIPVRNIHTSVSIAHMDDVTNTIKLLHILLRNPPKVCIV